jgi:hypothetical protein
MVVPSVDVIGVESFAELEPTHERAKWALASDPLPTFGICD